LARLDGGLFRDGSRAVPKSNPAKFPDLFARLENCLLFSMFDRGRWTNQDRAISGLEKIPNGLELCSFFIRLQFQNHHVALFLIISQIARFQHAKQVSFESICESAVPAK
jgi:hypothetical protein